MKGKARWPKKGDANWRPRSPSYDWDAIESEFVTGDRTRDEVCSHFGCSRRMLDLKISEGRWVEKKSSYRKEATERLRIAAEDETVENKREAIRLAYSLKVALARRLADQLQAEDYWVTPKDFEIIQRLEQDLRTPGWAKTPGEDGTTVNVQVRLEQILDAVEAERIEIIEGQPSQGAHSELEGASGEARRFLLGGEGGPPPGKDGDQEQADGDQEQSPTS